MVLGRVHVGVLGPTTLRAGRETVTLTPTQRRLVAALALAGRGGVTPEQLTVANWGDTPPRSARASLHNQVTRLRRHLRDDVLTWEDGRYRLGAAAVDQHTFEGACLAVREALLTGDVVGTLRRADEALRLWRGEPYHDLDHDHPAVPAERQRLTELHDEVEDARTEALLRAGRTSDAIVHLQELVHTGPHREARWSALAEALRTQGRRAEALATVSRARAYFVTELGLDPPEALGELQALLLREAPGHRRTPRAEGMRRDGPLVGREAVLVTLDETLATENVVVLEGDAGVGKSSVARAFATHHGRHRRTVTVGCPPNPWSALQPVAELLGALTAELDRLDPPVSAPVRALLDPAGPVTGGAILGHGAAILDDEVADALARVAARAGGLTIVVDDAHHAGPTAHRLLRTALTRSEDLRLLAVTRELRDLPPWLADAAVPCRLEGLDRDSVATLVRHDLGPEVDSDAFVTWLVTFTGGNALFVTALLEHLGSRGLLEPTDGRVAPPDNVELPPQLQQVVAATVERLSRSARRALEVAAVLHEPIDPPVLAELVDPSALDEAVAANLLERDPGGGWRFRHALVQRVAYELVPADRRAELHLAAASIGRRTGLTAPQLADHAFAAGALDPPGAVAAARAAGDAAYAALAYEDAAEWYDRAASVAATLPEVDGTPGPAAELLALEVAAADAQRLAGVPGHAARLLDVAEQVLDHPDPALRLRAVLAALQLGESGAPGPAQRRAAALADAALAREVDPRARAAISASASLVHSFAESWPRCRALFADALRLLPDEAPDTAVQVLPYAYLGLALPEDLPARAEAAARLCRDAEVVGDPVGAWEGLHLTFTVALQRGDGDELRAVQDRMLRLRDRIGDAGRRWSVAYQQAALAHLDGDLDRAERLAEDALRIGSGATASRAVAAYAGQLLELRRQAGRLDELVPVVGELADQPESLPAWRAAASFVLAAEDPRRSAALFDELVADDLAGLPRDFTWLAGLVSLARGAVIRADPDHVRLARRALAPYADLVSWQGTCTYGPVGLVLAALAAMDGDAEAAAVHARQAAVLSRSLAAPRYVAEAEELLRRPPTPSAGGT
ncbi:AAA family ATPase [Nitriliruptoraceae bacterium ZYF776]|nr:AAA family ATPase [Profundirhabdus halotolerans]